MMADEDDESEHPAPEAEVVEAKTESSPNRKPSVRLPNPPKCDIVNPKNKYCLPCDRDFNRRQVYLTLYRQP
jgi:hypothetical protein